MGLYRPSYIGIVFAMIYTALTIASCEQCIVDIYHRMSANSAEAEHGQDRSVLRTYTKRSLDLSNNSFVSE